MSRALITESYLTGIANAIRAKLGAQDTYTPPQMAAAIESIPTGGITPAGTVNINQNGTHDVTQYASANVQVPNTYAAADEGKVVSNGALVTQTSVTKTANGTYDTTTNDEVVVNVQPILQEKTATANGEVIPDSRYDGLSKVTVNVSGGGSTLITKNITQNGTYNASSDNADGYSQVVVNVSGGGGTDYENWDLTQSLTGTIRGFVATIANVTQDNTGVVFGSGSTGKITLPFGFAGITIEVDVAAMSLSGSSHKRFIMGSGDSGFIYRSNGYWSFYRSSWATDSSISDPAYFDNSTVKVVIDTDGYWHIYKDGVLIYEPTIAFKATSLIIGSESSSINNTTISAIRIM